MHGTHLTSTMQLIRLNRTTIRPASAQAAIGARQMLLETNDLAVWLTSFQPFWMCKLPDAWSARCRGCSCDRAAQCTVSLPTHAVCVLTKREPRMHKARSSLACARNARLQHVCRQCMRHTRERLSAVDQQSITYTPSTSCEHEGDRRGAWRATKSCSVLVQPQSLRCAAALAPVLSRATRALHAALWPLSASQHYPLTRLATQKLRRLR